MSQQPSLAAIRLQLAGQGLDPSLVTGVVVDAEGKLQVIVNAAGLPSREQLSARAVAQLFKSFEHLKRPRLTTSPLLRARRIVVAKGAKADRYRLCECGSGRKFKFCCGAR